MERYIMRKSVLYEVEKFVGKVRLTLSDDSIIEGVSWGLSYAFDDDGNDLGYETLVFLIEGDEIPIILREEQIKQVEQAFK